MWEAVVKVEDVLGMIFRNTVRASVNGLLEWADNGLHYTRTTDRPDSFREKEITKLEDFYAGPCVAKTVAAVVADRVSEQNNDADVVHSIDQIIASNCKAYGYDTMMNVSNVDSECERELELEVEVVEEMEVQRPVQRPASVIEWHYNAVLSGWSTTQAAVEVFPLGIALETQLSTLKSIFKVESSKLYVTRNFMQTIETSGTVRTIGDDYLRSADAMLLFTTGEVLLISDHEANNIIPLLRSAGTTYVINNVYLSHFAYERCGKLIPASINRKAAVIVPKISRGNRRVLVNDIPMLHIELFNGYTMFGPKDRKMELSTSILNSREAKAAALTLPALRGWGHLLNRSDLEEVCDAEGQGFM